MCLCMSILEDIRNKYQQIEAIFCALKVKYIHLLQLITYERARIFCFLQFHGSLEGREIAILQLNVLPKFLILE